MYLSGVDEPAPEDASSSKTWRLRRTRNNSPFGHQVRQGFEGKRMKGSISRKHDEMLPMVVEIVSVDAVVSADKQIASCADQG